MSVPQQCTKAQKSLPFVLHYPSRRGDFLEDLSLSVREEQAPNTRQKHSTYWTEARIACAVIKGKINFTVPVRSDDPESRIKLKGDDEIGPAMKRRKLVAAEQKQIGFRLKQHLSHDYHPSGISCAALTPKETDHGKIAEQFLVRAANGDRVGAVAGTDFSNHPCATIQLHSTTLELRLIPGKVKLGPAASIIEAIFHPFLESLKPTMTSSVSRNSKVLGIQAVDFASNSYWSRYPDIVHGYRGPSALFDVKWNLGQKNKASVWWNREAFFSKSMASERATLPFVPPVEVHSSASPTFGKYLLNSVGVVSVSQSGKKSTQSSVRMKTSSMPMKTSSMSMKKSESDATSFAKVLRENVVEIFCLYTRGPHAYMWLRWMSSFDFATGKGGGPKVGPYPLCRGYPKMTTLQQAKSKITAWLATIDSEIGAWDCVWSTNSRLPMASASDSRAKSSSSGLLLQVSSMAGVSEKTVISLAENICEKIF